MSIQDSLPKEKKAKKLSIKKIFKFFFVGIILFIYGAIISRSFMSCDVPLTKKVISDQQLLDAYYNQPELFEVRQYGMQNPYEKISEGRLIYYDKLYYIPVAKQLQFSIKYNTDVTNAAIGDGIPFKIYLKDKHGNIYDDYYYEKQQRFQYGYVRVSFRNIDINLKDTTEYYTVFLEVLEQNGKYKPLTSYKIYNGNTANRGDSEIYKIIKFKP